MEVIQVVLASQLHMGLVTQTGATVYYVHLKAPSPSLPATTLRGYYYIPMANRGNMI